MMPMIEIENSAAVTDTTINNFIEYEIHVVDQDFLSYSDFFSKFMSKNLPCVIKNVTNTWDSTSKWIKSETINHEYFITRYGDEEAPVADCKSTKFNSHCKSDMKVKDYMVYLQNSVREKVLYLKDWHLQKLFPNDNFYNVPDIFASDWLNEYAVDHKEDDFMFVYIGPKNSWTPLHVDVYCSYSWSVNVVGRKKWTLFPPGEENKLKDSLGNLPLVFDSKKYPNVKYFEIVQEKGDAVFVPSGWHHEVVNLLDTISINHNWINGCNIEIVWLALQQCLESIEKEITDLRDTPEFVSQCQIMLKSLFGMDYIDFVNLICYIGNKRLGQLKSEEKKGFFNFELGQNHILFDIKAINKIIPLIHNHPLSTTIVENIKYNIINIQNEIVKLSE